MFLFSAEITKQLPNIMPDFMLVFAIAVLAHHPEFESTQDIGKNNFKLKISLHTRCESLKVSHPNGSLYPTMPLNLINFWPIF